AWLASGSDEHREPGPGHEERGLRGLSLMQVDFRPSPWHPQRLQRAFFIERIPMDRRLITVSKFLAKHLRHAPEALGLSLQPGGWVPVDDLLAACNSIGFPISYDELVECVET